MPQLGFPIVADGLCVDVLVGLDGQTASSRLAVGLAIPPPLRARGIIDTGSDVSAVDNSILQQLGVPVQYKTTTQTAAGTVAVNLFDVSLSIADFVNPAAGLIVHSSLLVMAICASLPRIDVLVGLDVLRQCRFFLDGPGGRFTLDS